MKECYPLSLLLLLALTSLLLSCRGSEPKPDQPQSPATPAPARSVDSAQSRQVARQALDTLRKVADAAQVGGSFHEYQTRLVDAKVQVGNAATALPEGQLKRELQQAVDAYVDAEQAWQANRMHDYLVADLSPGVGLKQKYNLTTERRNNIDILPRDKVLRAVWAAAREHLEQAAKLVDQS